MSGGELGYAYQCLGEPIQQIAKYYNDRYCPLHGAIPNEKMWQLSQRFLARLVLVKKALYDIEWVMSGDYADGDEIESMMAVLDELI
jgi:hypothetical protein